MNSYEKQNSRMHNYTTTACVLNSHFKLNKELDKLPMQP